MHLRICHLKFYGVTKGATKLSYLDILIHIYTIKQTSSAYSPCSKLQVQTRKYILNKINTYFMHTSMYDIFICNFS